MRIKLVMLFAILATGLAGCAKSPTSVADSRATARLDTGVFGGSGNAKGKTESTAVSEVTAADSGSSRGGVFGGSGN